MGSYSRLTIVDHYSDNGLTREDPEDKNGSMLSSALAYISSLRRRLLPDMLFCQVVPFCFDTFEGWRVFLYQQLSQLPRNFKVYAQQSRNPFWMC